MEIEEMTFEDLWMIVDSTDDANVMMDLAKCDSVHIRFRLAQRIGEIMREEIQHPDIHKIEMVERELAKDTHHKVRAIIASNTKSPQVMTILALDNNESVIRALIGNEYLTEDLAKFIAINYIDWGALTDYAPAVVASWHRKYAKTMMEIASQFGLDSTVCSIWKNYIRKRKRR